MAWESAISHGQRRSGWGLALCGAALSALWLCGAPTVRADEIRLKDGNKLYGVIVAYEDDMFKVKTPFGYVLVEKDKIAEIVPSTIGAPEAKAEVKAKKDAAAAAKKNAAAKPAHEAPTHETPADGEAVAAPGSDETPAATEVSEKTPDAASSKRAKAAAILSNTAVKPAVPVVAQKTIVAPALHPAAATGTTVTTNAALVSSPAAPAAPKEPEVQPEEIHGNLYINHANSFTLYKAPSWNLIGDAGNALPNAIVAMGTSNESTLLVVGKEKSKVALEPAAAEVERRVREVYTNYRQISRRTTTIGGLSGIEYRFRGMADEHDWSGTLVVLTRGTDAFMVLGMTYADSDLIQIQENVISRSIASLKFE